MIPLDPYLSDVKEKLIEAKEYLEGKRVSTGIVVTLVFDVIMITLERMVIDRKGVKPIEQLRKEKRVYFDSLVGILNAEGVKISNVTELEILRDLRNKVVHDGYKPTEQNAKWAYKVAETFVSQNYPEVIQFVSERKGVSLAPVSLQIRHEPRVDEIAFWNEVFFKGFDMWIKKYESQDEDYYKYERNLRESLWKCFENVVEEKGLPLNGIQQNKAVVGRTRVDFLLGNVVSFEVKFEPDYPNMPSTRKPVTNVVLKTPDEEVAKYSGLTDEEVQTRLYEVELDFLKLLALKKKGIPYNYLLCLDEDGRLYRNLPNSFRTRIVKQLVIPWKSIHRGIDGREVHYFLWQA